MQGRESGSTVLPRPGIVVWARIHQQLFGRFPPFCAFYAITEMQNGKKQKCLYSPSNSANQKRCKFATLSVCLLNLCLRECYIIVSVYTICGTDIPYVFFYYMFRRDGATFRYIGLIITYFLFLLLSLHCPMFTHWECVVCMVFM
jgi:hypothetical protein